MHFMIDRSVSFSLFGLTLASLTGGAGRVRVNFIEFFYRRGKQGDFSAAYDFCGRGH
jgi:hypothetical protein